ncbi:MAG: DNA methyltransferase [Candidatus Cloacimonadia bacterium]
MVSDEEYDNIFNETDKVFNDLHVSELEEKYRNQGYNFILPKMADGTCLVWQREFSRAKEEISTYIYENGNVYTPGYDFEIPKTCWVSPQYANPEYGTELLKEMLQKIVSHNLSKNTAKSIFTLEQMIIMNSPVLILDYFAGSGTTAHAVINLNRQDDGNRKYIIVEMGEYFDTVTKPRIQKAIYSMDTDTQKGWKNSKPVSRKGSSHAFKYLRLESYEDTLNNIVLSGSDYDMFTEARESYFLSYMLNKEAEDSTSLLNVEMLDKPFSYKMNITRNLESTEQNIDLVETFNYLIGHTVKKSHALVSYDADFSRTEYGVLSAKLKVGDTYKFKAVEGSVPSGDEILIIWREMTSDIEKDNAVLDSYFLSLFKECKFKCIYVNCDNNLLNLRGNGESWQVVLIDEVMKKRMFEDTE